jgi:hypothetical protein
MFPDLFLSPETIFTWWPLYLSQDFPYFTLHLFVKTHDSTSQATMVLLLFDRDLFLMTVLYISSLIYGLVQGNTYYQQ